MSKIDVSALKSHYGEDIEIIEDLIEIFESSYPETIKSLEEAIQNKDHKNIELHAHTLKGMVANFFAMDVKEQCFVIEKMGRENQEVDLKLVDSIKKEIPGILTELKSL